MMPAAGIEKATPASHETTLPHTSGRQAFSIIELLVATATLAVILGIIFSITQMISQTWGKSTAKIEAFQGARAAFDSLSQKVSMATLNTYYDYFDSNNKTRASYGTNTAVFTPVRYGRFSDLHFISGKTLAPNQIGHSLFFQAPSGYTDDKAQFGGMDVLLTGCGYYVTYGDDNSLPGFVSTLTSNKPEKRYRFRLMQYLQPAQQLKVYDPPASGPAGEKAWFQQPLATSTPPVSILAENIIAMVVLPKLSKADALDASGKGKPSDLAPEYEYDTRERTSGGMTDHQLPPVVEIAMVAIDENAAQRVCADGTPPDFGIGLATLFRDSTKLEDDLKILTGALVAQRIPYRVFRSEIALRGAKWSANP